MKVFCIVPSGMSEIHGNAAFVIFKIHWGQ